MDHTSNGGRKSFEMESQMQQDSPKFALPVDSDHKAKELRILSFAAPHMRTFHLAWFSFFSCFVSTFATPPLMAVIRDNLGLTASDIGNAGIASVSGAIFARLAMGTACDLIGPRLASAGLIILTTPPVFFTSIISDAGGFLAARFMTGFALASFVSTQFWMSSMFSSNVVGAANGMAAGWGNLGGGVTQFVMPLVFDLMVVIGSVRFTAWRLAFFIPGAMQMASGLAVMAFGRDMPDGNYETLQKSGDMHKDRFDRVFYHGVTNYRGWILALTYGLSFGVELTINNIIAEYFFDRFNLNLRTAGFVAAGFGLVNIVSRPAGGLLSDFLSGRYGMRGRLWALWIGQMLEGLFCVMLGKMSNLGAAIVVMIIFSVFVQAAEGMTFGVVPFVSRRSLGLISGMTGAGGNVGAVITQTLFFKGSQYEKKDGIVYMGFMILACTLPMALIYFPQWGGMFCGSNKTATEETYYFSEWTAEEQEKNYHKSAAKFAENCRKERGMRRGGTNRDGATTVPVDGTPASV